MHQESGSTKPPRTMLELLIRQRRQTFEEFVEYAETFAREHAEPGTLSVRHLQRLAAGRRPDGKPLGPVRPATARLLERIFDMGIGELLAPPALAKQEDDSSVELRQMLNASRRVDSRVVELLHEQLAAIRRLDRQMGALVAHDEVRVKVEQVSRLMSHSLAPDVRAQLAVLMAELSTLAGWQALDLGNVVASWQYYERGRVAATESANAAFEAHVIAEQAFVLLDVGRTADAVELLSAVRVKAKNSAPPLLRSWLAAAHGEALAASGQKGESLRAFDKAAALLPCETMNADGPYVVLDPVHLARWRGHALARFADPDAVDVLTGALEQLDSSFTRAETALRVDLANALVAIGEPREACRQASRAGELAAEIGSVRQQRRMRDLTGAIA
ncbi:hypothetical protein [Allokutzneria sp. NRRL B-24872]|uniref:hypothetical protein n=1 Tax=Allokutzneria sp. NRRL B-24872 TaxID=1137961 RepID=UPI001FEE942E|nr:hypothetical protein [Allokutzneria sp. NRRL B-24872]